MKNIFIFLAVSLGIVVRAGAQCSTCGGGMGNGQSTGPSFSISMGTAAYGQSAGDLTFASQTPNATLFTPAALGFDALIRGDVAVITNTDGSFRQVYAPNALADIPVPANNNGYVINFYYPSQIGSLSGGIYALSGSPFVSWVVTNPSPASITNFQVSKVDSNSVILKQWTYSYSTNNGQWTVQSLGGIQQSMVTTNLSADTYQVVNSVQSSNGPVVQQTKTIYQSFSWGTAVVETDIGTGGAVQKTTYTYNSDGTTRTVSNPDGSWTYYGGYDANYRPTNVYSSFGDISLSSATSGSATNARETDYYYSPSSAGVTGSGDTGILNSSVPRLVVQKIAGTEVSRQYSVFPSVGVSLDIQCTASGAAWNASGNLVTTNLYYTSGPNQFALKAVIQPDGTMTTYDYQTNSAGTYRTNITATGQPNSGYTAIVDGVSNVIVLNQWGNTVSSTSRDVKSGSIISQETYGNFDNYGRPQQVTHLDGTTTYTTYACCGLDQTIDADGMTTAYLYDTAKRQYGYAKYYGGSNAIVQGNVLDAVGRSVQSYRVGTDNSSVTMSQSAYDTAGRLIAQTNALGGVTTYFETNDVTTGALIRTTINPDLGGVTNYYYVDGSLKMTIGSATHAKGYGYGVGNDVNGHNCTFTVETNLLADGTPTSEWTKTFTDMAGRTTETLYSDGHYSTNQYNNLGQLIKSVDPDGVATLYQYNGKGEQTVTAVAMNTPSESSPDFNNDRITSTVNDVTTDHSTTVRRSQTYVYATSGSSTSNLISVSEISADGLQSWQTQYRDGSTSVTSSSQTSPGSSKTVTMTAPDGSYTLNTYSYGRLMSSVRKDSGGNQIGGTTYTYDPHGRQSTMTDARNGTTTYSYNNADQITSVAAPMNETTMTTYDNMMRPTVVTQPDNNTVTSVYLLTGELGKQYGARTYPVAYGYDYTGRMQYMTNWSSYSGNTGARVTTWNYDSNRGWLNSKTYDDGHGPSYAYTSAGRLQQRTWVRGTTTTYAYDNGGSLKTVIYSDGTPGVTNSYDRLGRLSSVSWTNITDTMTYNLANELLTESFSGGVLNGLSVTNGYDQFLRRTNLTSLNGTTPLARTVYGYDGASRLSTVSDGMNNAAYTYLANSPMVSQITFKSNSVTRMTTTKSYDYLNRLTQISSQPSASGLAPIAYNYTYNTANQRTKDVLADGSYWIYQYDNLGQVTNGVKYFYDGTLVPGQQFGYGFDDIGNRKQTATGGDSSGANLRLASYTVNTLNQITSRDYPGTNDIIGAALATNSVTVNGSTNVFRKGEYFQALVKSNNTASAQWEGVSVVSGGNTNTGNLLVPQTPQNFVYDADGNLISDGLWTNVWNAENRLVETESLTNVPSSARMKEEWSYLPDGRWSQRIVSSWNGSSYVPQYTNKFVWDGKVLTAIVDQTNGLVMSFLRGTDLSGTKQGAGGVGGLLAITFKTNGTHFAAFDGNGDVMALVNAADGTQSANYEYGVFGEPIRITGSVGKLNPIRFSTQFADDVTGDLVYLYRHYSTSTGNWKSRDPMQEQGGLNIYGFIVNNSINHIDKLGLYQLGEKRCLCEVMVTPYRISPETIKAIEGLKDAWNSVEWVGVIDSVGGAGAAGVAGELEEVEANIISLSIEHSTTSESLPDKAIEVVKNPGGCMYSAWTLFTYKEFVSRSILNPARWFGDKGVWSAPQPDNPEWKIVEVDKKHTQFGLVDGFASQDSAQEAGKTQCEKLVQEFKDKYKNLISVGDN